MDWGIECARKKHGEIKNRIFIEWIDSLRDFRWRFVIQGRGFVKVQSK